MRRRRRRRRGASWSAARCSYGVIPPVGRRTVARSRVRAVVRGLNVRASSTSEGLLVPLPDWFLSTEERGNSDSSIPTWCAGNTAEPLIHGKAYFDRLVTEVETLRDGDHLFFTDWRGDPDERLRDDGPTIAELFAAAAKRGV